MIKNVFYTIMDTLYNPRKPLKLEGYKVKA